MRLSNSTSGMIRRTAATISAPKASPPTSIARSDPRGCAGAASANAASIEGTNEVIVTPWAAIVSAR